MDDNRVEFGAIRGLVGADSPNELQHHICVAGALRQKRDAAIRPRREVQMSYRPRSRPSLFNRTDFFVDVSLI